MGPAKVDRTLFHKLLCYPLNGKRKLKLILLIKKKTMTNSGKYQSYTLPFQSLLKTYKQDPKQDLEVRKILARISSFQSLSVVHS